MMGVNISSLRAIEAARTSPQFVRPLYDSYCFANIPGTISRALTGMVDGAVLPDDALGPYNRRWQKVALFFVDAFGWRFIEERLEKYPALKILSERGVLSKLTSQFPSTTAAHVTCINTGLAPGQSGVYEWNMYEHNLDRVIQPLMFSGVGEKDRDLLAAEGVKADVVFPDQTIYQKLSRFDVKCMQYQPRDFVPSASADQLGKGAKARPYKTLSEGIVNVRESILNNATRHYYFFYFSGIDTLCHQYGPNSAQVDAEIDTFLTALDRLFFSQLIGKAKDTLFLMTADHGMSETDPQTTVYLNNLVPDVRRFMKTTRRGEYIVPCGSPRDFFLHIEDGKLDEAQALLSAKLRGKADVVKVNDLIQQNYFGPAPASETFLKRVGNLVILTYRGESVWWYEKDRFEQRYYGHHGGLTPAEMEIPLFAWDFS